MIIQSPASLFRSTSARPAAGRSPNIVARALALFELAADHLAIGVVLLACPVILSGVALHLA
jgi:hypothetical protein